MKLGEEKVVPGAVDAHKARVALGIVCSERPYRALGLHQQLLAVALAALDVVHDAVAAREGVLQFDRDARQQVTLVGDRRHEGLRRREDKLVPVKADAVGDDPFDHRLRRPSPVIADAVEAHGVAEGRIGALDGDLHLTGEVGEVGDIAGIDAEGDDLAAVDALPDEGIGGERHLMLLGAAEDVSGVAVLDEDVGQAGGVAEAVDVVADRRCDAEPVEEIALAMKDLAVKAGGGRQVEVGLQELAAGDVPLAALDQLADAGEKVRAEPLGLAVDPGFAAGEDEIRIFVAAIGGRRHRSERLVGPGLPRPQPNRVDVGVADHVDAHAGIPDREAGQPFTAPAMRAPTMKRCRTRKTITAGTIEMTLAAARIWVEVWL